MFGIAILSSAVVFCAIMDSNGVSRHPHDATVLNVSPVPHLATSGAYSLQMPTYPSNCLEFAKPFLAPETKASEGEHKAKVALKIILVGAGLGGLATAIALTQSGHNVTVFEQTPVLGEVGAGIQVPSNSTKILFKLGLEPYLRPYVTEPESISFRRWQTGNVIGNTKLIPEFTNNFDAPYYVIHRAHFHSALCQKVQDMGIEIKLGARVVDYNPTEGSITLADGTIYTGDLVIAADGQSHIPIFFQLYLTNINKESSLLLVSLSLAERTWLSASLVLQPIALQ